MTSTTVAPPPSAAGTIGANQLVTFNWNPATQLTHFLASEAAVQTGTAGARVKIITLGDSTTEGLGGAGYDYKDTTSYPAQLTNYRRGSNLGHTQGRVGAAWPADGTLIFSSAV